jgi:Iap family predicted aminopeptidase
MQLIIKNIKRSLILNRAFSIYDQNKKLKKKNNWSEIYQLASRDVQLDLLSYKNDNSPKKINNYLLQNKIDYSFENTNEIKILINFNLLNTRFSVGSLRNTVSALAKKFKANPVCSNPKYVQSRR